MDYVVSAAIKITIDYKICIVKRISFQKKLAIII